jgi:hypothetical protein
VNKNAFNKLAHNAEINTITVVNRKIFLKIFFKLLGIFFKNIKNELKFKFFLILS